MKYSEVMQHLRCSMCLIGLISGVSATAAAQQVGTCDTGRSQAAFLDANNVRAAVYNAGSLFWKGSGNIYTVPKGGNTNSIFAASLWIGGFVGGELRFAGTDYGPFEYYPGPLTESGELPNPTDCSEYDRIYEVTIRDLELLDTTGEATADIRDWPWHLGAPVTDGDGNPDNYDLAAGDRPEITGHQMLWWVMNDVGGKHGWSLTPPLGIELRASAFAALSTDTAINNTTFYRYEIENPQAYTIDSVRVAFWVDVDLGNAGDDLVGSDTTLGMGFAYNGDDFDDTSVGYGDAPPAIGFDFLSGPTAEADGRDNDGDGLVDESGERQRMTTFLYYNGDSTPQGNPFNGAEAYDFMRAIWRDGKHVTHGGTGYGGDTPTNFMYPGDPVTQAFWSEENTDGHGSKNTPADRRFIIATGPFQLGPGETEEIVVAVVWARGADRFDSITELRKADRIVQEIWDAGSLSETGIPPAPASGPHPTSPADGVSGQPLDVTLAWEQQEHMSDYVVEIATTPEFRGPSLKAYTTIHTSLDVDSLNAFTDYFWRVTSLSPVFASPPSDTRRFRTSDVTLAHLGLQMIPGTTDPAFVEVSGPGGINPCGSDAVSTDGCAQTGGNFVYGSENSTGEYVMYRAGGGTESVIGAYAPNDYEIRFTAQGSYAYYPFGGFEALWVPFEVWDVGPVGFFNENDPADDVQMIPNLFADAGGQCKFDFSEGDDPFGRGWGMSDRIYAYYAMGTYADWEAVVKPIVEADPNNCPVLDDVDPDAWHSIDFGRGRPIQRVTFNAPKDADPLELLDGTVVRFYTTPPPSHSPILAAPASGTGPFEQPLELVWNAPRGSTTSQLQVSAGPTFENPIFDATTRDESFVISGLREGVTYLWRVRLSHPEGPWSDIWTFTAGKVTNVSAEPAAELPTELTLNQNYPNPFNPSTTIRFGLPESGPVKIQVYDLLGRHVATLVDGSHSAGWHQVTWDASAHSSGLYIYSVKTQDRTISKSLIMVR